MRTPFRPRLGGRACHNCPSFFFSCVHSDFPEKSLTSACARRKKKAGRPHAGFLADTPPPALMPGRRNAGWLRPPPGADTHASTNGGSEIPVWWRRAVLPSLPWGVCFLSSRRLPQNLGRPEAPFYHKANPDRYQHHPTPMTDPIRCAMRWNLPDWRPTLHWALHFYGSLIVTTTLNGPNTRFLALAARPARGSRPPLRRGA